MNSQDRDVLQHAVAILRRESQGLDHTDKTYEAGQLAESLRTLLLKLCPPKYPHGTKIRFRDQNGFTTDQPGALAEGQVRDDEFETNGVLYVPVYCERTHKETGKVVQVAEPNIIKAELDGKVIKDIAEGS